MPGRIAVITGGTRGIGLEVMKMLLKCDITVVLGKFSICLFFYLFIEIIYFIGCRNTAQGEALLNGFRENGIITGQLDVYSLDISVMDSVRKFATVVKEKYPKIHYLINNGKNFNNHSFITSYFNDNFKNGNFYFFFKCYPSNTLCTRKYK